MRPTFDSEAPSNCSFCQLLRTTGFPSSFQTMGGMSIILSRKTFHDHVSLLNLQPTLPHIFDIIQSLSQQLPLAILSYNIGGGYMLKSMDVIMVKLFLLSNICQFLQNDILLYVSPVSYELHSYKTSRRCSPFPRPTRHLNFISYRLCYVISCI